MYCILYVCIVCMYMYICVYRDKYNYRLILLMQER